MQFSGTLFPVNFFNISTLPKGGGARPSAPRRGAPGDAPSEKTCFLLIKNLMAKKSQNIKKILKIVQNFDPFFGLFWVQNFGRFFRLFLTFFQILSWTWGINFDTIACVFEPVYGPKNSFRRKFDFLTFFQNDLGIKNFLANRPSLIRKKYSRRPKPSYLQFFFSRFFSEFFKKIAEIM